MKLALPDLSLPSGWSDGSSQTLALQSIRCVEELYSILAKDVGPPMAPFWMEAGSDAISVDIRGNDST